MGILDDYVFNKYVSHILRKLFFNFSTKYEVIKNRQLTVFLSNCIQFSSSFSFNVHKTLHVVWATLNLRQYVLL